MTLKIYSACDVWGNSWCFDPPALEVLSENSRVVHLAAIQARKKLFLRKSLRRERWFVVVGKKKQVDSRRWC